MRQDFDVAGVLAVPPAWGSKRPRPSEGRFALWAAEATVSYHHAKTKESVQTDIYIYTKIPPKKKTDIYLISFDSEKDNEQKNIAFLGSWGAEFGVESSSGAMC